MERDNVLFSETQRFRQWWIWVLMFIPFAVVFWLIYCAINVPDDRGLPPFEMGLIIVVSILAVLLFYIIRMDTYITEKGIGVRFYPFHLKFRFYIWSDIDQYFIRKYSPIGEYGGWGIRWGFGGRGRAFNVSGNQGLQLVFRDGKKLLIGTNQPAAMEEAINKLDRLKRVE